MLLVLTCTDTRRKLTPGTGFSPFRASRVPGLPCPLFTAHGTETIPAHFYQARVYI
jgi:hypothetical protein